MTQNTSDVDARLKLAVEIAREAGDITLDYFRRDDLEVERKDDDSPVTAADRQAEEHLRQRIAATFPDDAILGEEFSDRSGSSGYQWILDPIDGTKSFIHGVPLYGALIGVEHEKQSVLGVIRIPATGECVYAASGGGAWYTSSDDIEPRPARVSNRRTLAESLFVTSEVLSFDQLNRRKAYDTLQAIARLSRTWGDCYGYMMVATGRAELMVDPIMAVWDAASMLPILEEAGGTFTDWQGRATIHAGEGIATNGHILDEVLDITRAGP